MGQVMIDNYIAIKRAELAELEGKSNSEQLDYYMNFI